jgi:protein involved in polysaccharide export with SLBB domain
MKRNGMTLRCVWASTLLAGLCWALAGCADGINPPSPEQLAAFEQAGPGGPVLDLDRVAHARLQTGPYRLVPGDVLQIDMPARLDPDALTTPAGPGGKATHVCRVSDSGMITLPDGREVAAKGRSLGEVESAIVGVYYPSLVKTKPAVYAHVLEYATANIRVMGGVTKPGIYHVRHDQMSLLAVLMEAGEIVEGGAATIRIVRSGPAKDESRVSLSGTMSLPTGDGAGPLPRVTLSSWPESEIPGSRSGELSVRFKKDGPLRTTGVLTIESGHGRASVARYRQRLSEAGCSARRRS